MSTLIAQKSRCGTHLPPLFFLHLGERFETEHPYRQLARIPILRQYADPSPHAVALSYDFREWYGKD
jgi:hypothetical protein